MNLRYKKDYDYVSYHLKLSNDQDIFACCFATKNWKIISLDGDVYWQYGKVLSYKE